MKILNFDSTIATVSAGIAAAPSISFANDPNTGIYSPGADQVAISTGGTGRLFVDASGNVGVGTTNPVAPNTGGSLTASGTLAVRGYLLDHQTNAGVLQYNNNVLVLRAYGATAGTGVIAFNTGGGGNTTDTERVRIDSSGRLLLGTVTSTNNVRLGAKLAVVGTTDFQGAVFTTYSNTAADRGSFLDLCRSKGTTDGSLTAVATNDALGYVTFRGTDGAKFVDGALIKAEVDGIPGTDDMPGRLVFSTTADGAASPTERMRITSTGQVRLAGAGITFNGDTATANELDDYEEGTWTPTIVGSSTAGTGTYTVQSGRYTKVGRSVYAAGTVIWSAHDGTGNIRIAGLPFTALNVTELTNAVSFTYVSDITIPANSIPVGGVFPNNSYVTLYSMAVAGGTPSALGMDGSGTIYFSLTYQTA